MESGDSSDNLLVCCGPGYDNDQEQDAITIPITSRTPSVIEGYTKENGVTVINFDKSKQVVCEICSQTLKSMKGLESHKKAKHSDDGTCFYCSEKIHETPIALTLSSHFLSPILSRLFQYYFVCIISKLNE